VPPRGERQVHAEVAGLQVEVHDLRQALHKNTESLSEVREGFQRLRGELNGVLPRLEEKVERVIDQLNGREETEREYIEKVRVHETRSPVEPAAGRDGRVARLTITLHQARSEERLGLSPATPFRTRSGSSRTVSTRASRE
jgi:hypothetical protein